MEINEVEETIEHGPSCNCYECWSAHGEMEVDEFGIPIQDSESQEVD